jgi:D-3-phosphoglycerate dehydrogenase
LGIAVINAPAGNTVAVAELFFGGLIALLRHVAHADVSMRGGLWERSALLGRELRGRKLGIVGLGRIGSEVAKRALAFEMEVSAYDPFIADARFQALRVARVATLDELLQQSDVLTVHTPLTDETRGMIGRKELGLLGAKGILVNLARGGIVDEEALVEALSTNGIAGAVVDVFDREPPASDHPLRGCANVVLTPHIGAATLEAQRNVAVEVCAAVREALLNGELSGSVNIAAVEGISWSELGGALQIAARAATVARAMLASQGDRAVRRVAVRVGSRHIGGSSALLAAAAAGVLEGIIASERLNLISARSLAEGRGIEFAAGETAADGDSAVIEVAVAGAEKEMTVAGSAHVGAAPRLTRIGDFHIDVQPRGTLIILTNRDVPGVIGRVGTLLGDAGVNIAEYHQARLAVGGEALAAISVDGPIGADTHAQLLALSEVRSATIVRFDNPPGA